MAQDSNPASSAIGLILETDSIIPPITGIGRYTFELLKAFHASEEVVDLRCIERGRWKNAGKILQDFTVDEPLSVSPFVPQRWYRNPAKAVLRKLLPLTHKLLLDRYAQSHIYHSPNYRLAPFKGRKIATFHDLSLFRYPEFHPRDRIEQLAPALDDSAGAANHIITDTETVRREVLDHYGLADDQVTAIHLASSLDPAIVKEEDREAYLSSLGLHKGGYLLFASTLEPRKNVLGILEAYSNLPAATRKSFPLVLAGQLGWKVEQIASVLSRGAQRGDIRQTGYISNRQLACLYSGARSFVYPSYYEGFGLPVIEAQQFGVPVITSDCSCLPEVTGGAAVLVNPGDRAQLTQAMRAVVEDDALHAQLRNSGLVNSRRFSWQSTAQQTLEVYRRVMAG